MLFACLTCICCMDNTYNLVKENISEHRQNILVYSDDNYYVTFMSGLRENNYKTDGISNEKVDFSIISFNLLNKEEKIEDGVNYKTTINGIEYSGQLLNNPYDNSYVIDLSINTTELDNLTIVFSYNSKNITINLTKINDSWKIDGLKALKIVCDNYKDYLKQGIQDNKFNGEVYIKVVHNDKYSQDYYWYIQIVSGKNSYSAIINPTDGEILAQNIS